MNKKELTMFVPFASTSLFVIYEFLSDFLAPITGLFIIYLMIDYEQTKINAKIKYHETKEGVKGIKNNIKRKKIRRVNKSIAGIVILFLLSF